MISDLIYDVGMNNGDDTAYYLHKGYRVIAVEADPMLVDGARARFADAIAAGRLTLVNVAIGPAEATLPFWICEDKREWNSFDRAVASRMGHPHHAIDVRCRRFSSILHEHGVPFYLKVDIEGHDHYCIDDLDPADAPQYVSLELDAIDELVTLKRLGYQGFKIIRQTDFSPLSAQEPSLKHRVRKMLNGYPALLNTARQLAGVRQHLLPSPAAAPHTQAREHAGWIFPIGSSGAFGEETAGPWQSCDEAAYAWLHYKLRRTEVDPQSLDTWHDLHATRAV